MLTGVGEAGYCAVIVTKSENEVRGNRSQRELRQLSRLRMRDEDEVSESSHMPRLGKLAEPMTEI